MMRHSPELIVKGEQHHNYPEDEEGTPPLQDRDDAARQSRICSLLCAATVPQSTVRLVGQPVLPSIHRHPTLPLWILTNLSRPNQLPIVNVVAFFVVALSVVPVYLAHRLTSERDETGAAKPAAEAIPIP